MSIMSKGEIPTMVSVNGVIMNVSEESSSCLAGIKITTSSKFQTYSDRSGEFSITEVITNRKEGLAIEFYDEGKRYTFESISLRNIIPEANQINISVIIEPLAAD